MLIVSPFIWQKLWKSEHSSSVRPDTELQTEQTTVPQTVPAETVLPGTQSQASETATEPSAAVPAETLPSTEPAEPDTPFVQGDASYFSDALFIGDSRTVGISEYGNLKNADYFATVGMTVYTVETESVSVPSVGKMTLDALLSAKEYGKIYIMLGINELGYDFDKTVQKYKDVVAYLREKQPETLIFIEANLHVTESRSETDPIFSNDAINRYNAAIAQLADNQFIFYIDINELFDDENGNLRQDYSSDNTHVLAKYYADWSDWLCSKTVQ